MLELPRGGKVRAQDAAVSEPAGTSSPSPTPMLAGRPDALRELIAPFAEPRVGYVCGEVRLAAADGTNQEGLYWRYELAIRGWESRLRSVTGGNGAIYATRREAYQVVDPIMGHDLSFPFKIVKHGWLALYNPKAVSGEKMVPTIEGEFARKRRMMAHTWPIVVRGGMLSPRGYDPLYALMIFSHRVLRYLSPFAPPDRAGYEHRADWSGMAVCGCRRDPGCRARRRCGGPRDADAAPAGSALLRFDDRIARGGSVGLASPRDLRWLGARCGDAVKRAVRPPRRRDRRDR